MLHKWYLGNILEASTGMAPQNESMYPQDLNKIIQEGNNFQ